MILPRQRLCALLRPLYQSIFPYSNANAQSMSTGPATTQPRLSSPLIWSFQPQTSRRIQPLPVRLPITLPKPSWSSRYSVLDPFLPLNPLLVPNYGPVLKLNYPKPSPIELPASNIIEKSAARMIVIRKRKMRKHKLRKLRKRMFYEWAKVRQRRETRKERAFQAELVAKVKAAEKFDPQAYVEDFLARLHEPLARSETRPPIHTFKRNPALVDEHGQRVKPRRF